MATFTNIIVVVVFPLTSLHRCCFYKLVTDTVKRIVRNHTFYHCSENLTFAEIVDMVAA